MRKLNGFILTSVLVMICSVASAQMTIVIDGQQIPTEHISSIVVLPNTNTINVSTTVSYTVEPVADNLVAIGSFTVSSASVVVGQNITLSWTTSNAVSCTATNGVDGWSGSSIALPNGSKSITTATTGSHTFTLNCAGSVANDNATRNVVVNVTAVNAVSITSFTASPATIEEGGSTTLSWSTLNAASCTPTGGTGGWTSQQITLPSGSVTMTISSEGTYNFTLVCQGVNNDEQSRSTTLTVTGAQQSCDQVTLAGNVVNWNSFWGVSFPGPVYENITNYIISQKGYLAIRFDTGNVVDDGKVSALENASTPGIRTGSYSQCPGDFNVPDECKTTWGLGGGLRWATNGKLGACQLQPNTTYYFNITFTDGVDPNSSSCNSTPCRINLQHINL